MSYKDGKSATIINDTTGEKYELKRTDLTELETKPDIKDTMREINSQQI